MRTLKIFTHCTLLTTTPALVAQPQEPLPQVGPQTVSWFGDWWWGEQETAQEWVRPSTYDEIMQMLDDLASGELERKYPPEQLERVNEYIATLAKEGILPDQFGEELALNEDIADLMYGEDSAYQLTRYLESSSEYMIIPAVLYGKSGYNAVQCGMISKAWSKTKKFVKEHKKEIIIGAVIVVAVAAVTVAVVVASSAGAGSTLVGAAGAAGGAVASNSGSGKSESSSDSPSIPNSSHSELSPTEIPIFKSSMEDQIASFKSNLVQENFFGSNSNGQGLSLEETGRAIGPLFAHESLNHFNDQLSHCPQFSQEVQNLTNEYDFSLPSEAYNNPFDFGHNEVDKRFSSNYGAIFSDPAQEVNFNALSYQARGEAANFYGYHNQAIHDFSKALEMNPTDVSLYLQRSSSYFNAGQYDHALIDYRHYTSQVEQTPQFREFSLSEFTLGLAKGIPKGAYKSAKDLSLFLCDFVKHPIQTSTQVVQAVSMLVELAKSDEWSQIADTLVPEARQLINEWDTISWNEKGERTGSLLTEYGGDILIPGASVKLAKKGVKGAKKLTQAARGFEVAKDTLLLETASEIGNAAKVREIVNSGTKTLALGEELGFSGKEMGQLKQAGNLEAAINSGLERLITQSESEVYQTALNQNKHIKTVRDNLVKPAKEIQKSINSYEKQIAIHKDKIANPKKHIPDWDTLDPRQCQALINKKWPTEIKVFEEHKSLLQSILNERLSYE